MTYHIWGFGPVLELFIVQTRKRKNYFLMACFIANKIHQRKQTMRLAKALKKLNAARKHGKS